MIIHFQGSTQMTSAERKAAEASAPPVQTGYYDPNNPGMHLICVSKAVPLNMPLLNPPGYQVKIIV